MPKEEKFWNPYRLIPVKEKIEADKKPPVTKEKFVHSNGIITCSLTNLTPLFIGGYRDNPQMFLRRNHQCVIPGSSLKGMLRSLAEIVGGGCSVTDTRGQYNKRLSACDNAARLCIACRIFGMMERGRNAQVHQGNVTIGDALIREEKPEFKTFQVLMSNCGTRHEPFYRSPHTGSLDGKARKLYFHQPKRTESVPKVPENLQPRSWLIDALLPGHHFDFEVQFSNLRQEELCLLIYSLALEGNVTVQIEESNITLQGPMRHKIGNAKPLGLGSCRIDIQQLTYLADPGDRYRSLKAPKDTEIKGPQLEEEIGRLTGIYVNDDSETMKQLRKMMVWDENDPREFSYPDYFWFKNPGNSQKELKRI